MRRIESRRAVASNGFKEQSSKRRKFGTIVRAIWPDKPALNLAQRLGCSERAAQFYIDGERKVSAQAARVVFNEMFD